MGAAPNHVLTVNEVRDNLKALREAALYERAEIHFGERGADEVVILASKTLAALKQRARRGPASNRSTAVRERPQPAFVTAILAGGTFAGPDDLSERVDEYLATGMSSGEG